MQHTYTRARLSHICGHAERERRRRQQAESVCKRKERMKTRGKENNGLLFLTHFIWMPIEILTIESHAMDSRMRQYGATSKLLLLHTYRHTSIRTQSRQPSLILVLLLADKKNTFRTHFHTCAVYVSTKYSCSFCFCWINWIFNAQATYRADQKNAHTPNYQQ